MNPMLEIEGIGTGTLEEFCDYREDRLVGEEFFVLKFIDYRQDGGRICIFWAILRFIPVSSRNILTAGQAFYNFPVFLPHEYPPSYHFYGYARFCCAFFKGIG